ncbi:MAG: 4Fe-4S binding protein [Lentisphaerae bacterium]|nr:4Fe-4S binding protein [Lentisphaerota bacterium]
MKSFIAANRQIPWKWLRRCAQLAFLLVFLWLFRMTEYRGDDELTIAVNWLFRLDPLVAVVALLAAKTMVATLLLAFIVVGLTLLLGRFFCGWVCPLGTLIDAAHRLVASRRPRDLLGGPADASSITLGAMAGRHFYKAKYFLLGIILIAAACGVSLIGYFDPIALLVRALTFAVDPILHTSITAPSVWLLHNAPETVTSISEPVYGFLKANVLPFRHGAFLLAGLSFSILAAILALEWVGRRFWCRNLCPLGALLGLLARPSLVRRIPSSICGNCRADRDCADLCRMKAFDRNGRFAPQECNLCMDCVAICPQDLATFAVAPRRSVHGASCAIPTSFGLSRRFFLVTALTGLALPVLAKGLGVRRAAIHPLLVRPPGARDEAEFLNLCVRCGECMKVCPTNALQPILLEAGIEGMFSPRLAARMGYCAYNCTLCGQVCPTTAIRELDVATKQQTVIGKVEFDKELCLPLAKGEQCLVCEEFCPVPEKAIRFREAQAINQRGQRVIVKQPYLEWDLCIGCGVCETKCPLPDKPGIRLLRAEYVPKK